ncbi:MAG: sigma-70 family RNA polymerase sigma factor [Caldilineales bacterium]
MTDQLPRQSGAHTARDHARRTEGAFDALFLAHYESVFRQAYRVTGNAQEAEDLAQEAFVRLHGQTFSPDRDHSERAWLLKVVTNLAFNAIRGNRRRDRREEVVYGHQPVAVDPADAVVRRDEQERVRLVLQRLPERQASLLLLRHAGLSYNELASVLDVAPGSIGTVRARAHAAFAAAYQDAAAGPTGGDDDDT